MKIVLIALCTVMVGLSVAACVDQEKLPLGTEAKLLGLTVGDARVSAEEVPAGIAGAAFDQDTGMVSEPFGTIKINKEADKTNARVRPVMSRDATARWGLGSRSNKPDEFYDTRVPITFESAEFIYIEVTSGDHATRNYYRFNAHLQSWVTDLSRITVTKGEDERIAKAGLGYDTWNDEHFEPVDFHVTTAEATGALIVAETFDPGATIRYGQAKDTATPSFTPASQPITLVDQNFLYVEVTAANTIDKTFFKFRVNVGRMNTIKELKFTGNGGTIPDEIIYGLGLSSGTWANVGKGEFKTPDQPSGGYGVTVKLDDPDGSVDWVVLSTLPTAAASVSGWGKPAKIEFKHNDYLVIRVQSRNDSGTTGRNFYQIKLTMLAAKIKTHPKSAWYLKNAAVTPLTVELDRAGNFEYQWYESDSWYGIYGRHGTALDEKNNISFVNGGPDMYYYLVQPDGFGDTIRQPGGADEPNAWVAPTRKSGNQSASYTPPNDWDNVPVKLRTSGQNSSYPYKPNLPEYGTGYGDNKVNYITGSTSESRYYWCVIKDKDSGYTVTTDRALILTETDDRTKHFIFDLSVLKKKNETPFKIKRELYKIYFPTENYFPADFDPSGYEDCVAQAQYFLPDGRAWTQNWTHGDIHFGYEPGSASYEKNGSALTWWQNNLGANSGAIPLQAPHSQQGGLAYQPDWVGVAPSGDPDRGLPPNDKATGKLPVGYKPSGYPEGTAQGYFCGYIELLELRFATAPK